MKKTANLLVTAYLLLLFVAYPFYMKEGYVEIGRAKYSFWIRISLSTAAVLLLFFVIRLIRELKEKSLQLQATDISILVFAGTLLLTLALAVDRKEALFGTEGWNMGFALYGVLCLLYLMIRLLWKPWDQMDHLPGTVGFRWSLPAGDSGPVFHLSHPVGNP